MNDEIKGILTSRLRTLSCALLTMGALVWVASRVLAIPLDWWRERFPPFITDLVSMLNWTFAPALALVTLISSVALIVSMRAQLRERRNDLLLAVGGGLLAVAYLAYFVAGIVLLMTMDF
ncbi:MAG: hypothetical protein NTW86_29250 [Candidatus Sumerlaeota bacterium]|nr:hypothetical protein [Candidatus Sumerlaeota bacterium]